MESRTCGGCGYKGLARVCPVCESLTYKDNPKPKPERWEYVDESFTEQMDMGWLDKMGEDGWELASYTYVSRSKHPHNYIFKRRVYE